MLKNSNKTEVQSRFGDKNVIQNSWDEHIDLPQ